MGLDLGDFDAFATRNTFRVAGKQYSAPLVRADVVLWTKRVHLRAEEDGTGWEEARAALARAGYEEPFARGQSMEEAMLGAELVAELSGDGVPWEIIERAARAIWIGTLTSSNEAALAVVRGDDPNEASPANRAERRAAAKKTPAKKAASGSRTTNTAAAATTRSPASGSGTRSPRKSANSAKGSPGAKS